MSDQDKSGWEPTRDDHEAWKTGEMSAAQDRGKLFGAIVAAMDERQWKYDDFGDGMIRARVHCKAADFEVFLSAIEEMQVLRCWVIMPVRVDAPWRAPMCELFNRINFSHLLLGNFELDANEGTPRWRGSMDVEGGELVPRMVNNLISAGLSLCDTFWPAIMAVSVLGSTPETALKIVTEG